MKRIAFVGRVGAGKTTLFNALQGNYTLARKTPVSYTHLDVYKRQRSTWARFCLERISAVGPLWRSTASFQPTAAST